MDWKFSEEYPLHPVILAEIKRIYSKSDVMVRRAKPDQADSQGTRPLLRSAINITRGDAKEINDVKLHKINNNLKKD